jgi:hypothetical protein
MPRVSGSAAIAIFLSVLGIGPLTASGTQTDQRAPDFKVQIWGEVSIEFRERLDAYAELRRKLERGLPPLRVTDDARELVERVRKLGERIRAARRSAKEGDVLTPAVSAAFRKALAAETNATTCAALLDENPGKMGLHINDTYPTHEPFSTMPPNVLAALPRMPEDIEYRLEGHDLLLLDMRARLVIDRMTFAVRC